MRSMPSIGDSSLEVGKRLGVPFVERLRARELGVPTVGEVLADRSFVGHQPLGGNFDLNCNNDRGAQAIYKILGTRQ